MLIVDFIFYFASNMLICLSPCLTELGSLPEAVEIRGGKRGGGVIVLLDARSPLRLGGRMRRLAGLQRSEVVWEQLLPLDKKREEDSFLG